MLKSLIIVICIALALWVAFSPVKAFLFGAEAPPANNLAGEWVGRLDLLGGYVPSLMGETPGPHTQAAIHFKLVVTDGFVGDYGGTGELCILGETKTRAIKIGRFSPEPNGYVSSSLITDPMLTDARVRGQFAKKSLTISQLDHWGLTFRGVLDPGTDAEFRTLCSKSSDDSN